MGTAWRGAPSFLRGSSERRRRRRRELAAAELAAFVGGVDLAIHRTLGCRYAACLLLTTEARRARRGGPGAPCAAPGSGARRARPTAVLPGASAPGCAVHTGSEDEQQHPFGASRAALRRGPKRQLRRRGARRHGRRSPRPGGDRSRRGGVPPGPEGQLGAPRAPRGGPRAATPHTTCSRCARAPQAVARGLRWPSWRRGRPRAAQRHSRRAHGTAP